MGAVPLERSVSHPRSSNWTCGFPASSFPTGLIVRPTAVIQRQNSKTPENQVTREPLGPAAWGAPYAAGPRRDPSDLILGVLEFWRWITAVGRVEPCGKLDAGNPHVSFDERGWETDRSTSTTPVLNIPFVGNVEACIIHVPPSGS